MSVIPNASPQTVQSPHLLADARTIALLLAGTMVIMAAPTISPALAGLEARFSDEPNAAFLTRMLVSAPSLPVILLAPLAGYIADRFGKTRMLLLGGCLFGIAGTTGLFLPSLHLILISRLVLGVAVAMIMTSQMALIGDCFVGEARTRVMGWQISARNFGGMIFISIGGVLAGYSPQLPFAIFALAFLYVVLVHIAFRNREDLVAPQPKGSSATETDTAWLPPVLGLSALMVLTVGVFFQMPTQLPFFVAAEGYDSATMTGVGLGVLTFSGGISALLAARIKRRIGMAGLFALGFFLMATGFGCLSLEALGTGQQLEYLLAGTAVIGSGFAMLMPAFNDLLLSVAPATRRGTASGILTTGGFIGQVLSPLLATPVITVFGFQVVFQASMAILLALGLCAFAVGRRVNR